MNTYEFYVGQMFEAHKYLGAHADSSQVTFRVFAPGAAGVCILHGGREIPMYKIHDGNFYEVSLSDAKEGDAYEHRVYHRDGSYTDHCDPYGFRMELRPDHRSVVCSTGNYSFHDAKWMKNRNSGMDRPVNIYELHLGSWKRKGEEKCWYRYEELAELLVPYLKEKGYNYVEFLPLSEHPADESWGYQNTGFFAPTSRYGEPEGLKRMVDLLHQNDIGVILDFVPVHFAVDDYGLARYDGNALYEYPHEDVGVSEWGSYNFMHSRGEVRSFLQSCANYWLSEFHIDGLRMDAISRIIYWHGDAARGVNGNAVEFIKVMNRGLKERNPGCMLIAEDSTNYPDVTGDTSRGGLGFDYKWDMGWMHDTLQFFQAPPVEREAAYHKLTFSMMYYYNERYLLPFSHDEVVHGKATILQKMYGGYEGKFPQGRALYLYMMVHPGKKLNFMGNEFGQLREWDEKREQDWEILKYPVHDAFLRFLAELNQIYLSHPALYAMDFERDGFFWIDCHQEAKGIYAICRRAEEETVAAVLNLSDREVEDYSFEWKEAGERNPEILIYTDWERFGGGTGEKECIAKTSGSTVTVRLSRYSGVILTWKSPNKQKTN